MDVLGGEITGGGTDASDDAASICEVPEDVASCGPALVGSCRELLLSDEFEASDSFVTMDDSPFVEDVVVPDSEHRSEAIDADWDTAGG